LRQNRQEKYEDRRSSNMVRALSGAHPGLEPTVISFMTPQECTSWQQSSERAKPIAYDDKGNVIVRTDYRCTYVMDTDIQQANAVLAKTPDE
jgi:hypothetical protein